MQALYKERTRLQQQITRLKNQGLVIEGSVSIVDYSPSNSDRTYKKLKVRNAETLLPNGKRTLHLKTDKDIALYEAAITRGRQIKKLQSKIRALEQRISNRAETLGIKNPFGDRHATAEWYTPPALIEMARVVMGRIDLDPASSPLPQTWIQADTFYTKETNGLTQPWYGKVWCNPPYGTPSTRLMAREFLEKAIAEYTDNRIEAAILLLNRTGAKWYVDLFEEIPGICHVTKRINFIDAQGEEQKSPRYYNDVLYLGTNVKQFEEVFEGIGRVTLLV